MKHIICLAMNKGGVCKTTTAVNLAGFLTEAGNKVLAIDMDPQGSMSIGLGVDIKNATNTSSLIFGIRVPRCPLQRTMSLLPTISHIANTIF